MGKKITAYKAFNDDWTCRDFQYEVGKTYKINGDAALCRVGFHACINPLDCFEYYPPTGKLALVEYPKGAIDGGDDTKVAGVEISIKAELSLPDFIKAGVDYILSCVESTKAESNTRYRSAAINTGDRSAATNTGYQSAAINTGYLSAATNTGDQSAATNTGDRSAATNIGYRSAATNTGNQSAAINTGNQSAATNTGDWSAATNTGNQSAAEVSGKDSAAIAIGYGGKVRGSNGCALFCVERDDEMKIISCASGIVGKNGVKPETWYRCKGGEFVEAA